VDFLERCRIAGQNADAAEFIAACAMIEMARVEIKPEIPLTYFEFTTLAFFALMGQQRLDVAILEVGLGGRLDAVNIIDTDCAIITSIDLDHMEYLGNNRESIGFEKAGILRAGKPAIVGDPMPPESIAKHAKAIGADLYLMGTDFNFSGDKQQWGWAAAAAPLRGAGLPGFARCQPVDQRQRRTCGHYGAKRKAAGDGAGRAQRVCVCRAAGALSDRAGPAHAGAGRGA
jgi:dihydrofolate synthase / folylpolyglutamate synthase